jgi:hypothetical protein
MNRIALSSVLLLSACFSSHAVTVDISSGLVSRFDFNNAVVDSTGNVTDAQIYSPSNDVVITYDRFGAPNSAIKFTDSSNSGSSIWGSGIDLASKSLTISFWFRAPLSSTLDDVLGVNVGLGSYRLGGYNPGGSQGNNLHIRITPSIFRFSFFYDDMDVSQSAASNVWNHLSVSFDQANSSRNMYLNGFLIGSQQAAFGFTGNNFFELGGRRGVEIDDIRFYQRALTSAEVASVYAAESVPEPSALSLLAVGLGGLAMMRRRS